MMARGAMMDGRTTQTVDNGPSGAFRVTRARDLMQTPYVTPNERRGVLDAPWFDTWLRQNLATGAYWRAISSQSAESYGKANRSGLLPRLCRNFFTTPILTIEQLQNDSTPA